MNAATMPFPFDDPPADKGSSRRRLRLVEERALERPATRGECDPLTKACPALWRDGDYAGITWQWEPTTI